MPVTRCGGSPYRSRGGGGGGGGGGWGGGGGGGVGAGCGGIDVFGLFCFSQLAVIYVNHKIKQKNHQRKGNLYL